MSYAAAAAAPRLASSGERRRVALVGAMIAGVATQYHNMAAAALANPDLDVQGVPVRAYADDALERWLAFLPPSLRGTARSVGGTRPLFARPGFDLVWTQLDLPVLPWLLTANAGGRAAVIYTADSTPALLRSFGAHYGHWGGRWRVKTWARDRLHATVLRRASIVNAWTRWAARSMESDYGVDPARITVLPPGVDLEFWKPAPETGPRRRPRILFVGGDFTRKGGDLLLDVWRQGFRERADLHIVSREGAVDEEPGVWLHTGIEPNDRRLPDLYRASDVLVIPTRADCFSMAGLEGMACGLPVVTCPVGGVGELFQDGVQGMYVPPDRGRWLAEALELLLRSPARRQVMGAAARRLAVDRYDARRNAERLLALTGTARMAA